jgi:hypothetical protein
MYFHINFAVQTKCINTVIIVTNEAVEGGIDGNYGTWEVPSWSNRRVADEQ